MLEIKSLCKDYDFAVLRDVNITLPDTGFVGIIGESGSGKSTLLKCIGLLESITCGEIIYDDISLTALSSLKRDKIRGRIFSYIPQEPSLIEDESVDKGLSYFCEDSARRREVLEMLKIQDKAQELARNLSGGERGRVAIAIALLRGAPVFLCDEITSGLDEDNARLVYRLLKDISAQRLVICVGHDAKLLRAFCDRTIELCEGKVVSDEIACDLPQKQKVELAKKTSLGVGKFFGIFFRNFKFKAARVIFCCLSVFIAMFGFCLGTTQAISGNDELVRKQLAETGTQYAAVKEYQESASIALDAASGNAWVIFVDFEKDGETIGLKEGKLPDEGEVLISEFAQKTGNIKVGDTIKVGIGIYLPCRVSGIMAGNALNYEQYPSEFIDENQQVTINVYPTLLSYFLPLSMLDEYDKKVGGVSDHEGKINIETYRGETVLTGKLSPEKVLASVGFIAAKYGYDEQYVRENANKIYNAMNKVVAFNNKELVISGICDSESDSLYSAEYAVCYDDTTGYVLPVSQVDDGNFLENDWTVIGSVISRGEKMTRIGLILFAVFTAVAIVLLFNLDFYEIDEKKMLFAAMRRTGFSFASIRAYPLAANLLVIAVASVLYLAIGVPIIATLQTQGITWRYVLNVWAVVLALVMIIALALATWLLTLRKFNKEIKSC